MQRIAVSDDGVEVSHEVAPLVSMHGKEMRPGSQWTDRLPWTEITSISISAAILPPDELRWVTLDIDLTWGEFITVSEDAEGFDEALQHIAQRSQVTVPDLSTIDSEPVYLWKPFLD